MLVDGAFWTPLSTLGARSSTSRTAGCTATRPRRGAQPASHAFSPCAVAVVVEDGELPPSECRLCVWQQIGDVAAPMDKPRLSGDMPLLHTPVASNLSNVLYAPYPMAHGRKPRVVIFDMRKAMGAEIKGVKKALANADRRPGLRGGLRNLVNDILRGNTPVLTWFLKKIGARSGEAVPLDPATEDEESLFTSFANAFAGAKSKAEVRSEVNDSLNAAKIAATAQLPVLIAQLTGSPLGIVVSNILAGAAMGENFGVGVPNDGVARRSGKATLGAIDGAITGLITLMSTPKFRSPPGLLYADELAESLEVLASTVTMSRADMRRKTSQSGFRREALVWAWLLHTNNKVMAAILDKEDNRGFFSNSTMDTSELGTNGVPVPLRAPLITTISVQIEDPNWCGASAVEFEFLCKHDDAVLLSMARQGMLESLDRIRDAVINLENKLTAAIADNQGVFARMMGAGSLEKVGYYVWDSFAFSPWGYLLHEIALRASGAERLTNKLLDAVGLKESVQTLEQQRLGLLQIVLVNVGTKLGSEFVAAASRAQMLRQSIAQALLRTVSASTATAGLKPLRVLRQLPHKSKRATQLYPGPEVFPIETYDVEAADFLAREKSAFSDTVRETSSMFTQEQAVLRHLVPMWERSSNRLVLKAAHAPSTNFATRGVAYTPPQDSYGLVLQLPSDVQRVAEALSEADRRRMRLLADTSQPSAMKRIFQGAKEAESTFAALAVYCEFWTGELVRRGRASNSRAEQARSFAQASHVEAGARAEACAQFVLDTTPQSPVGFFDDDDPIFKATQQGRDARILVRRLGGLDTSTDAIGVRWLREVASELFRIAKMTSNSGFPVVPSEPLQSLFIDPNHGEFAHRRARLFAAPHAASMRGVLIVRSIAASYPSLLVPRAEHVPPVRPVPAPAAELPMPTRPAATDDPQVQGALARRAAGLRLDFPLVDAHEGDDKQQLAERFATMNVAERAHFCVPYGFGDTSPPLTAVAISAIMFGSVPVWSADWRFALLDVLRSLDAANPLVAAVPAVDATRAVARLQPQRRRSACGGDSALPGPSIVRASDTHRYTFFASAGMSAIDTNVLGDFVAAPNGAAGHALPASDAAAAEHVQDQQALALSRAVNEIAWNAERTLQCVLLAVARQGTAINLSGALPPDPPPRPDGPPPRDDLSNQRNLAFKLMLSHRRRALKALQNLIRKVRKLEPEDAEKTRLPAFVQDVLSLGEQAEQGVLSSDVSDVHVLPEAHPSHALIKEEATAATGGAWINVLKYASQGVQLAAFLQQVVRLARGDATSLVDLSSQAAEWARDLATRPEVAYLGLAAIAVLGKRAWTVRARTFIDGDDFLDDLLSRDFDEMEDDELLLLSDNLAGEVDRVYDALPTDGKWKELFQRRWSEASGWDQSAQTQQRVIDAMTRRLAAFRRDPFSSGSSLDLLVQAAQRQQARVIALQQQLDLQGRPVANPLGGSARFRDDLVAQRARAERRRLVMSYILGTAVARVVLGAGDGRGVRFAEMELPANLNPADVVVLKAGLERLLATVDAGPDALRFSEACMISELVTFV